MGAVIEWVCRRRGPHPMWIPHRGAVRRLGGGYGLGGGKGTAAGHHSGGRRYPWWCDGGGDCPYVERVVVEGVPTRAPPWIPHRGAVRRLGGGYRLGVRKTAAPFVLPADAGIHGGVTAVGTALTSSGSVVEGVPTRAPPWIPHRGAVRRLGGRKWEGKTGGYGGGDGQRRAGS